MSDGTIPLLQSFLVATPEQRKSFWDGLTEYCEANDIEPSFYHPYVPLMTHKVMDYESPEIFKFKTRYDPE